MSRQRMAAVMTTFAAVGTPLDGAFEIGSATRKNILGAVLWGTTVVALTAGVLWSFV